MDVSFDFGINGSEKNVSRYFQGVDRNFLLEQTNDNTPSFCENPFFDLYEQQSLEEKDFNKIYSSVFNSPKSLLSNDEDDMNISYEKQRNMEQIKAKNKIENTIENSNKQKPKFIVNSKAFNKNSLKKYDFCSLIAFIVLFSSLKGRLSNEIKQLNIVRGKHDKNSHDNAKKKVFRKCFKVIGKVIKNLCKKIGYKFFSLNRKLGLTNIEMENDCKRTMEYYLINNQPRHGDKQNDRRLFNEMKLDEKFQNNMLLQKILNMNLGEVLIHFLEDDNFVQKEDPLNKDFTTFSDNFKNEFCELRKQELLKDLRKIAYRSQIIE